MQDAFEIKENKCVKIMIGAKLPQTCDTVIPIERCINDKYIEIPEIKKGANVRIKGEENTPKNLALLASQVIYFVKVFIKTKIAILSSGNELKEPWEIADEEEIYNVNSHAIKALLQKKVFDSDVIGIIPDNLEKQSNL
ncbi:hypothetical protein JCM11957_09390 [Caminibacter profundus]